MIKSQAEIFEELCKIPPLRKGSVRLVHRCIDKGDTVSYIAKFGLVFNKAAAGLTNIKGGSYNSITEMASAYDENGFWDSLKRDDFCCYDNARYADTKLIFDIPLDEFCFLETFGRRIKGKVDAKYLVAKISNINADNPNITLSQEKVCQAQAISRKNPYHPVQCNDIGAMIEKLLEKTPLENKAEMKEKIKKIINRTKDDFLFKIQETRENRQSLIASKLIKIKAHSL